MFSSTDKLKSQIQVIGLSARDPRLQEYFGQMAATCTQLVTEARPLRRAGGSMQDTQKGVDAITAWARDMRNHIQRLEAEFGIQRPERT